MTTMTNTFILILVFLSTLSFGQKIVHSQTISLTPQTFKKCIQVTDGPYNLYFDADSYLTSISIDSISDSQADRNRKHQIKTKLVQFFTTRDTLLLNFQTEKNLNVWIIKEFQTHKNAALARGDLNVINAKTKKYETLLWAVKTTDQVIKETANWVSSKITSSYSVYSADKKHLFFTNEMFVHHDYSK